MFIKRCSGRRFKAWHSHHEGIPGPKGRGETERGGSQNSRATGTLGCDGETVRRQTEREVGSEQMRKATEASAAAASETLRAGSAVASDAQEITAAWARYAEEVMRHTSESSQALLRARTFAETLEVQAKLLRDNMQSSSIKVQE
jgi:hypothetical protein